MECTLLPFRDWTIQMISGGRFVVGAWRRGGYRYYRVFGSCKKR